MNLVGELVTVQARLSQIAGSRGDAEIVEVAEAVQQRPCSFADGHDVTRQLHLRPAPCALNSRIRRSG